MKHMIIFTALLLAGAASAKTERVYIGTSKSPGIYFADLDTESGKLSLPRLAAEATDPNFLTIHPSGKYLYATGPAAFRIERDGTLTALNRPATDGKGSCHVSLDSSGKCLMTAYYGSGQVASFRVLEDGSLSEAVSFHRHEGSGEHPKRQDGPHAHAIVPNPADTYAYAPDLGIDKVMIYKLDPEAGSLTPASYAELPGGSIGPRHMKWDAEGKHAYVLNELDLSLTAFKATKNGSLELIKTASVLPEGADSNRLSCAEIRIHPNGKFIYTSTRDLDDKGRDCITVFSRFEDGFQRLDTVAAGVAVPRNFNIDPTGKWMLVGGQRSSEIGVFAVDADTGMIHFTGQKVPFEGGPICFEFLD